MARIQAKEDAQSRETPTEEELCPSSIRYGTGSSQAPPASSKRGAGPERWPGQIVQFQRMYWVVRWLS
jgi:hypothetical protein